MTSKWTAPVACAILVVLVLNLGLGFSGAASHASASVNPVLSSIGGIASNAGSSGEVSAQGGTLAPNSVLTGPPLPVSVVPRLAYHGPAPAHVPAAWGGLRVPPGAPIPSTPAGYSGSTFYNQWSNAGAYPYGFGTCVGKWPSGGQSFYSNGCIGHDEPAINPFSDLPGSRGNVSWNVSLPIDASPTHNQSDLYAAIWFGMDLYDPYGYNGQCFLELQLYPDTNGAGFPQPGVWGAFIVAWQIELSTGFEDPCIAEPLLETGTGGVPLQMNQGDHLFVNMTGWQGSSTGENITLTDTTSGVQSSLNLFNTTYQYPLNPMYLTNNLQDSLPWSPGGDLPVAFAFESGHTIDNPGNDTFGGCNSGLPPPTPLNPSTPCGSYNPKDWARDTQVPWHFYPVVFFNAKERQTAAQYGFEQDFGASAWIDGLSYGTCNGRDGSAYCSYPWYSYAASLHAFEFGATDYTATTQDFGQYGQYDSSLQTDSSGLNFYPVKNFTYSVFPGDSLTIGIQGSGTVRFLDSTISSTTTFTNLPSGAFSLNAVPEAGMFFEGYQATGSVALDAAATPWSSFQLSGSGTLNATFGSTAPSAAAVTFVDSGGHGFVTEVPGFSFHLTALYPPASGGFGLVPVFQTSATNVANGRTMLLLPGIYSVQANPDPGYNFTGWTWSPGIYVYMPSANYTWVNVTGSSGTLTAHYRSTSLESTIWLTAYPAQAGSIRFDSTLYASGAVFTVPQGTYAVEAIAAPGYQFVHWGIGFMSTMTNYSQTSYVLVQNGSDYLTAAFSADPVLTQGNAGHRGGFAINGALVSHSIALPQIGNLVYQLEAIPKAGFVFTHWSVNNSSLAWIADLHAPMTSVQVNASANVTPHYAASKTAVSLGLFAHGGSIVFNAIQTVQGHATFLTAPGTYVVAESPLPGYAFTGWSTSGDLHLVTTYTLNSSSLADVENLAGTWQPCTTSWCLGTASSPRILR